SSFRKPPVQPTRRLRFAVSKQTLASSRGPTRMVSALLTVPLGTRRLEARNCPTSVRLQRLSIQSFSACSPGSRPEIVAVPGPGVGRASCLPSAVLVAGLLLIGEFPPGDRLEACATLGLHGLPSRKSAPSINSAGGSNVSGFRFAAQTLPRRTSAAALRMET